MASDQSAMVTRPAVWVPMGKQAPDIYGLMTKLDEAGRKGIDPKLFELVKIRALQINCTADVDRLQLGLASGGLLAEPLIGCLAAEAAVWSG